MGSDVYFNILIFFCLQQTLKALGSYCTRQNLKDNITKTKTIKFKREDRRGEQDKLYISGKSNENFHVFFYLVDIFSSRLPTNHQLDYLNIKTATNLEC